MAALSLLLNTIELELDAGYFAFGEACSRVALTWTTVMANMASAATNSSGFVFFAKGLRSWMR